MYGRAEEGQTKAKGTHGTTRGTLRDAAAAARTKYTYKAHRHKVSHTHMLTDGSVCASLGSMPPAPRKLDTTASGARALMTVCCDFLFQNGAIC